MESEYRSNLLYKRKKSNYLLAAPTLSFFVPHLPPLKPSRPCSEDMSFFPKDAKVSLPGVVNQKSDVVDKSSHTKEGSLQTVLNLKKLILAEIMETYRLQKRDVFHCLR